MAIRFEGRFFWGTFWNLIDGHFTLQMLHAARSYERMKDTSEGKDPPLPRLSPLRLRMSQQHSGILQIP